MSTSLIKSSRYLTVEDVLLLELPHFSDDAKNFVLWEYTGYPAFFSGTDHVINELRRELSIFRDRWKADWPTRPYKPPAFRYDG